MESEEIVMNVNKITEIQMQIIINANLYKKSIKDAKSLTNSINFSFVIIEVMVIYGLL